MQGHLLKRTTAFCLALALLFSLLTACSGGSTQTSGTDRDDKRIAFTFDDGPHGEYTQKIVDKANALGGNVTFFIVGTQLLQNETTKNALVYAASHGAEIGIHAFTHKNSYDVCDEQTYHWELSRTAEVARELVPSLSFSLMRPVGGRITEARVAASPYAVIHWSIDTRDWELKGCATADEQEKNVNAIKKSILGGARDGAIVLMHDLYENSYLAFCRAAEELVEQGYRLVTVSELLGEAKEAGKIYHSSAAP